MQPSALHKIAQSCTTSEVIVNVRGREYAVDIDHILMAVFPRSKVTGRNLMSGRLGEFQLRSIKSVRGSDEAAVPGLRALFNW
jgi:hypothetical protein